MSRGQFVDDLTKTDGIEAARLTDERPEPDEYVKLEISHLLQEAVSPAGLDHESTSSQLVFSKNVKNGIKKAQKM